MSQLNRSQKTFRTVTRVFEVGQIISRLVQYEGDKTCFINVRTQILSIWNIKWQESHYINCKSRWYLLFLARLTLHKKHTLFPKDIYRDPICTPHRQTDRHNEGRASVNMFSFRMTKNTWVYWREHPSHSPEENVHSHHGQGTRSRTLPDQNGLHSDHIRLPRPESPCNLPSLGLPAPLRGRTVIVLTPKRPQP